MATEWNAAEYRRLSEPQLQWGRQVLAQLELRGDERVLDAGCGAGRVTAELLERLPRGRVVALDLSFNMVATAQPALAPRFAERVLCAQADLLALPLRASVDVVFSTAVFHWVRDHDRLFGEIFAALRPGGRLVAQCGGGPNLKLLRDRALTIMREPRFAGFFRDWHEPWEYPDDHTTAGRLRHAGFVDIETSLHPALTALPNAGDFREFERTVTLHRHLAQLPDAALREEMLDRLTESYAADSPPFTLDYWRLNLRARKPH